jgi:crotonobetaine/carnitine-CoA ligase
MHAPDFPLEHRTIGRVLAEKARRIPGRPLLRWQGRVFDYASAESLSNRYANGFTALGVRHGDHVAVMMPNCPEFLWTVWGLGKIGAVAVPLNTAAKGDMLAYFVDQSDSRWMVFDAQWSDRVAVIAERVPKVDAFLLHGAEAGAEVLQALAGRPVSLLAAAVSDDDHAPPVDRVRHDDTHLIMYTSGTTGPSKGVMCPHSQGLGVGRSLTQDYGYGPEDVLYTCLPLFHANALWYSVAAALWADASVALSPRFSASAFWEEILESGATQFNSLGAMTNIIMQLPEGPHERAHRLRQCMVVPMQKDLHATIRHRFGIEPTSLFAMTENYAVTSFLPGDRADKAGSAGSGRGASELRIVDDDGTVLPPGEVGEIQMRPLQPGSMMTGYYRMPEATEKAFDDGWFCTGDRGRLDADGYLWFVDRKKEAIRRRGENVSAYEVELILSAHPAILEAAAIAVPSELSEDEVMVYLVRRPGAEVTHEEMIRFADARMSHFMVPRFIEFIDALPKTATEKIEKYKLQQDARERRAVLWDREKAGIRLTR